MTLLRTFPGGTTIEFNKNCEYNCYRVCSASGSLCHIAPNLDAAVTFADVYENYYKVSRRYEPYEGNI